MAGINRGDREPMTEGEARCRAEEVSERRARQSGRLEVALQVKALLRHRALAQETPGARPLTPEEKAVWNLAEGFAQRTGATLQEVEAGHR